MAPQITDSESHAEKTMIAGGVLTALSTGALFGFWYGVLCVSLLMIIAGAVLFRLLLAAGHDGDLK